jgi:hypothetical protein
MMPDALAMALVFLAVIDLLLVKDQGNGHLTALPRSGIK